MFPTCDPFAAAFIGASSASMVVVINNRVVPISDIPKPRGEKDFASDPFRAHHLPRHKGNLKRKFKGVK